MISGFLGFDFLRALIFIFALFEKNQRGESFGLSIYDRKGRAC